MLIALTLMPGNEEGIIFASRNILVISVLLLTFDTNVLNDFRALKSRSYVGVARKGCQGVILRMCCDMDFLLEKS